MRFLVCCAVVNHVREVLTVFHVHSKVLDAEDIVEEHSLLKESASRFFIVGALLGEEPLCGGVENRLMSKTPSFSAVDQCNS